MNTRLIISALVVFAIIGHVDAVNIQTENVSYYTLQPPPGPRSQMTPEERAKHETDWMKTELALTENQIQTVDSINLKYAKKRDEMRKQSDASDFRAIRPKMEELRNQKNEELKSVLSDKQMEKYLESLSKRRRNGSGHDGPRN
jgi:hypothetical protein